MYRALDVPLVRVALEAGEADLPGWPDLAGAQADPEPSRAWLRRVCSHGSFAEAIEVASPVLAAQVGRVCHGHGADPRRIRRMVLSVARYLLRARGRSTPFGLFAGVAAARFGPEPTVQWGREHRAVARADAVWLASLVTRLEACPDLLRRLPVVANNLCNVRGKRLVLPFQEPAGSSVGAAGQAALTDVSLRHTRAVEFALRNAHAPIVLSDLVAKLAAEFPQTSPEVVEQMLAELVRQRVLLTALRPPMTVIDGLGHVVAQLRAADAEAIPQIAGQVRAVHDIAAGLARHNRSAAPGGQSRSGLVERMRAVDRAVDQPVMVDLLMDLDVTLPDTVAREAETAAAVLTRLTPYPHGLPAWSQYHDAFLERYGPHAVVPLLELVGPNTGLGFPATYRGSAHTTTEAPLSERDRTLLTLVQQATMADQDEITLDDQVINDLSGEVSTPLAVPPHVELFVQVHADSVQALRRGEFTLVVTGAARAVGATTGRFLGLLDQASRSRFRESYAGVATLRAAAMPVQVSCPPVRVGSENVARAPAALAQIVSAGEHRRPGWHVLALADLAVGGDAHGLYLLSLSQRELVEPTALNAVEFRHFSQPLARFLCEVWRARAAVYMPFSWGAASSLPFLPRIRYRRTVLSPARWNLTASDLPDSNAPWPTWRGSLAAWRGQFRVPRHVYLVEADNLLPLDLDQDLPQQLLRAHVNRHGHARLDEAPPAGGYGWIHGHAHEIAVPLAATGDPLPQPAHLASMHTVRRGEARLPGVSPWLYVKLYADAGTDTDVLADLAGLLAGWDPPAAWWYVPYRDPQPHLRIRVRLAGHDGYGSAMRRLGSWAARLRRDGLLGWMQLDTYQPETGRYGYGQAMAAAERVFVADSAAALAQRQLATRAGAAAEAAAVASLVELTTAFVGDLAAGMRWLVDQLPREPAPVDRTLHAAATRTADPRGDWAALRGIGGEDLVATWRQRREALADYRRRLAPQRDPMSVLASLLHLHHVRMFGVDPDRERIRLRLARAAALRWLATTTGGATP